MTPEEKILERLEAIEDKLSDLQASKENSRMLIEQLTPIGNHAFRLAIEELETLNGRVSMAPVCSTWRAAFKTSVGSTSAMGLAPSTGKIWRSKRERTFLL